MNSSETTLSTLYEIFEQELVSIINKIAKNSQFCEQMLGGMTPSNIPQIELDKFRYSLIPNNVPTNYQVIHLILIQSIRAAALLHDIGHPPFSHIVEFALKAVYEENKNQNNLSALRFAEYIPMIFVSLKIAADMLMVITGYL